MEEFKSEGASKELEPGDYRLNPGSAWVEAGTHTVCLHRSDAGLIVTVYDGPSRLEDDAVLDYQFFDDYQEKTD